MIKWTFLFYTFSVVTAITMKVIASNTGTPRKIPTKDSKWTKSSLNQNELRKKHQLASDWRSVRATTTSTLRNTTTPTSWTFVAVHFLLQTLLKIDYPGVSYLNDIGNSVRKWDTAKKKQIYVKTRSNLTEGHRVVLLENRQQYITYHSRITSIKVTQKTQRHQFKKRTL